MALISDNYHEKKLKKYGINIKTKYIVGNKILERNTNGKHNEDIKNGIRTEKQYYLQNKLIHKENLFDSRIEYTFITNDLAKKEHKCLNCGMTSNLADFVDGCPYCQTYYNIDYIDKNLGSKFHYDLVLKSNTYRVITAIVDVIISLILSFIFIKVTSRTFNSYDVSKIFIYAFILSLVLYYFFYLIDAYIVLGPIKRFKEQQNQKQIAFWNKTKIDKKMFFNNLNSEIRKMYYSQNNIIDYDILDYLNFEEENNNIDFIVKVTAEVRIVTFDSGKIKSKIIKETYAMKKNKNGILELNGGANLIKCHNCGSSIDVNHGKCSYCSSEIKYHQEWIMIN